MKRIIKLFSIIFLMQLFISNVKAEDYKTGDLISYKNIKFYVMEDNGDYLTLLKATPLTVDEVNNYGKGYVNRNTVESKGTAYDVKGYGYGSVLYCSSEKCNYNDSDIKHIVDSWSNSVLNQSDLKEVNVTYTKDDSNQESVTEKYKVRLITKDELVNNFNYSNKNIPSIETPKWIYNFSYWIIDDGARFISSRPLAGPGSIYYGEISELSYSYPLNPYRYAGKNDTGGLYVRPVIHLNKSASITKIKNNLKDINDTEFKIGDIIEYNGKEFYVLKDASKIDDKLTLVTKMPLSYEELNKMDRGINTLIEMNLGDDNNYHPGYVYYYYSNEENQKCKYDGRPFYNGCTTSYDKSLIKPIVEKWAGQFFENNVLTEDDLGYKARLITVEELNKNLKYVGRGPTETNQITSTEYYEMSEDTPFALYDCFTMSQILDSNYQVYSIDKNGNVEGSMAYDTKGICPVLTIKKKVATNSNNNNINKDNKDNKVSIPDTLLKNPVFIVVIGIFLIVIATVIISLILKKKK